MSFKFFKKIYFKIYHLLKLLGIFIIILLPNIVKAEEEYTYTELTYIESTSQLSTYIDTEYKPNGNTEYIVKYGQSYTNGPVFGAYNTGWTTGSGLYHNNSGSAYEYRHYYDNVSFMRGGQGTYELEINKGKITDLTNNTILKDTTTKNFQVNYNLYIFSANTGGNVTEHLQIRLYYLTIKENGEKIREFIPCKRSDGRTGLYDKVENKFYTNPSETKFFNGGEEIGPINPTPEPSENILTEFITLYIDRINYLAVGTEQNPYLMTWVGIIFSFIVLEMLLHIIHIRGGYKK